MSHGAWRFFLLACAIALGCADGDSEHKATSSSQSAAAVAQTAVPVALPQPTAFFRLDIALGPQGQMELRALSQATLSVQPIPPLRPEYLAVTYAGEDVLSAVPVSFDRSRHRTKRGLQGELLHQDMPFEGGLTTVFVESTSKVTKLAVIAPGGKVALEVPGDRLAAAATGDKSLGGKLQAATVQELRTRFPHIIFLREGQDAVVNELLRDDDTRELLAELITPTDQMNDVLLDGLSRAAPGLLAGVRSIGVGRPLTARARGDYGWAQGSTLLLNSELLLTDAEGPATVLHEAAHIMTDLLDAAAGEATFGAFDPRLRAPAEALVARYDLVRGFARTWLQLHESGLEERATGAYRGERWDSFPSQRDANREGFATAYGSMSEFEDIAEYVGTLEAPYAANRGVCPAFAGARNVTTATAIPYAKLVLLLTIGAITEAAFNACALHVAIDPPVGIDFPKLTLNSGLRAGRRVGGARSDIGIEGSGPNGYRMLIQLALPSADGSPLGLHRLAPVTVENVRSPGLTGIFLANENPRLGRASANGFVLVTEVSSTHLSGLILGLVLQNGAQRATDRWPLGTFSVPL